MHSKPAKYGIKIWTFCDSSNGYCLNQSVYLGKEATSNEKSKTINVVLDLLKPFNLKGRNITTDNYFTSLELAREIKKQSISLVGTVNRNKKFLPPEFITKKNREEFSSMFGFQEDVTIVSYIPKKKENL